MVPVLAFSQYGKTKFTYREAPKAGEIIAVSGIALVAMSATGLFYRDNKTNTLSKTVGYVGGAMIFAGVVIDLSGKDNRRFKFKKKGKYNRIRIKF